MVPEARVLSLQVLEGHLHQHSHIVPAHWDPLCTWRADASELQSWGQGRATRGHWWSAGLEGKRLSLCIKSLQGLPVAALSPLFPVAAKTTDSHLPRRETFGTQFSSSLCYNVIYNQSNLPSFSYADSK